jgi:hypothetical protein
MGLQLLTSSSYELPTEQTLGRWILRPHRDWEWFFHPPDGTLYRRAFQVWHQYVPSSPHVTHHRTFRHVSVINIPPPSLLRATAQLDYLGHAHFEGAAADSFATPPIHHTIEQFICSHQDYWPLRNSSFPADPTNLIRAIQEGQAHGVCDGSYMADLAMDLGTAAWCVEDPLSKDQMWGLTQTSGTAEEVDSYRSELHGVHSMH